MERPEPVHPFDFDDPKAIVDACFQNIDIPLLLAGEGDKTTPEPLRLVLLGRTGTGKSATGNTILDMDGFESRWGLSSVTTRCQREEGMVCGRTVSVVDTPGFFATAGSKKEIRDEVVKSVCLSAPGPHAFVLVLSLKERLTAETKDTIKELHKRFGKDFKDHTIILFTHLDALGQNQTVEDVINQINSDTELRKLFSPFENRIHAFDNNNRSNRDQVRELLEKVDRMVQDGGCYTDEMYRIANEKIWEMVWRIFKKCIEWIRRRVEPLLEGIKHGAEQAWERIKAFFRSYIHKIITSCKPCYQKVCGEMLELLKATLSSCSWGSS